MKDSHKLLIVGIVFFVVDLLSKYVVRTSMEPSQSVAVINNVFHITFVQNTGALFGMFKGLNFVFVWLTIIALGFILFYWDKFPKGFLARVFLVLIVVGLIGNLIDRVFLGHVVDFLDFRIWPVFNIADSLVSAGVAGLIFCYVKKEVKH